LRLTQPQVSRLIANLEDEVGFPLFVRRNQRLLPTQEAQTFYLEAERLLRGFDEVRGTAARIKERKQNHIRIVTTQPLSEGLVAPALDLLMKRDTQATVSIEIKSRVELDARIAQHHFDVGVVSLPLDQLDVQTHVVCARDAVVVLPKGHHLSKLGTIDIKSLANEPMIAVHKGTFLRDHLEHAFAAANIVPTIRIETGLSGFACRLVAQGLGVALTDPFVAQAHKHEGLEIRALEPKLTVRYGFVVPRWQPLSAISALFMDLVREVESKVGHIT
jgi:DNA-binding transcriptional LysR family regulator